MAVQALTFSPLELCDRGEYEAAAELSGLTVGEWPSRGVRCDSAHAEAILVAGTISSALGSIRQSGDQAVGREMLTESVRLFGSDPRSLVAQSWLVWADYWDGELDRTLTGAERLLAAPLDSATRFRILMLRSAVYWDRGQSDEAFAELAQMETLYDECGPLAKGKFHNQRALIYRQQNDLDHAIADYDYAINFFQEAGSIRWQAVASNNLVNVYLEAGQFDRAHEYAAKARELFRELGDKAYLAEALDQTAQIYLAQAKRVGETLTGFKGKQIKQFYVVGSTHENDRLRAAEQGNLPNPNLNERREVMSPLETASHLIRHAPENAAYLLDLIIMIRSVRGDPKYDAQLDDAEEMLWSKTPQAQHQQSEYRKSRLMHDATSDS